MLDYYIDSIEGNDLSGDGSILSPYKTLQHVMDKTTTLTDDTTIYLKKGEYICDTGIFTLLKDYDKSISIIGVGVNSILKFSRVFIYAVGVLTVNINRLIFDMTNMGGLNANTTGIDINFNNVVFINTPSVGYATFFPRDRKTINFNNCLVTGVNMMQFRLTHFGFVNVKNSYGMFANGYGTTQSQWDTENNYITKSVLVDDYYRILDENVNKKIGLYRGDFSWSSFLIKCNGKYYSVDNRFYDTATKSYIPLDTVDFNYNFTSKDLLTKITINGETFRPVDKFNNFALIRESYSNVAICGIKKNKVLLVQTFDINISLLASVLSIFYTCKKPLNESIKIVFSRDMGDTWETILDNNSTMYTDCIIPKKKYDGMTLEEKNRFIAAKETISEIGFTPEVLAGFNFNSINVELIRFAIVLSTDSYTNNPSISSLQINYDEKGYLQELKDSECDIEVFEHTAKVTSKIDAPMIQTSIII